MEVIEQEFSRFRDVTIHPRLLCEELEMPRGVFALVKRSKPMIAERLQLHPYWWVFPSHVTPHL
jgi:hypothetical protein